MMKNKIKIDDNTYVKISYNDNGITMSVVVDHDDSIYSISLDLDSAKSEILSSMLIKNGEKGGSA